MTEARLRVLVLVLTDAVATSPKCPTIAVSTYCSSVPMSCCITAGSASFIRALRESPFSFIFYGLVISEPKYFFESSSSVPSLRISAIALFTSARNVTVLLSLRMGMQT